MNELLQNGTEEEAEDESYERDEPKGREADGADGSARSPMDSAGDALSSPERETETADAPAVVTEEDAAAYAPEDCGEDPRAAARAELIEFTELYPEVSLSHLPDEVRSSPLPLSAAYALYERRASRKRERAAAENKRNAERAAGGVTPCDEAFYTPDEVRRMSSLEVRANYDAILRSMKRWR